MSKGYLDASSFHVPCLYYEPRSEGESSFAQIRSSIPGKCEEPRRTTLAKNRYSTKYITSTSDAL